MPKKVTILKKKETVKLCCFLVAVLASEKMKKELFFSKTVFNFRKAGDT